MWPYYISRALWKPWLSKWLLGGSHAMAVFDVSFPNDPLRGLNPCEPYKFWLHGVMLFFLFVSKYVSTYKMWALHETRSACKFDQKHCKYALFTWIIWELKEIILSLYQSKRLSKICGRTWMRVLTSKNFKPHCAESFITFSPVDKS
jgi:hypothetical protein